jgi:hypothetical protein
MSLFFFDEIFFLETVILDVMTAITEVIQHSLNSPGAATETVSSVFNGTEPIFGDQFYDIVQPLFIRSVIHNTSLA